MSYWNKSAPGCRQVPTYCGWRSVSCYIIRKTKKDSALSAPFVRNILTCKSLAGAPLVHERDTWCTNQRLAS